MSAAGCSEPPLSAALLDLRHLPGTAADSAGDVPPQARPLLRQLKAEFQQVVLSEVHSIRVGVTSASLVRARVIDTLRARGMVVGGEPDPNKELGYGYILDVAASAPDGHDDLLAITFTISITCGADTSFYLFRKGKEGWNAIVTDEVSDYGEISDAHFIYQYKVSPPAPDGSFLILTTWVSPACWSVWRSVQYRLYKVTRATPGPVQLASTWTDALAIDEGYEVKVERNAFTISYMTNNENDPGMRIREDLRLRVEDNQVITSRSRPGANMACSRRRLVRP